MVFFPNNIQTCAHKNGYPFTYLLGEGGGGMETLLARKKQRDALAKETPWEASLRKERERKKARKRALKERIQEVR